MYLYLSRYRESLSINDKANGAKYYQLVHLGQEHVGILGIILVT